MKDKRRFREQVAGGRGENSEAPRLTAADIEDFKIELMLQTQCSIWPVESSEELGKVLARLTKAVAERPFKYLVDPLDHAGEKNVNLSILGWSAWNKLLISTPPMPVGASK